MKSWKRQVKKRSSNCNSQNISVQQKGKKKTKKIRITRSSLRVTGLILTYLESVAQCIAYIFARCPRSVLLVLICILPTASILCVTWKVRAIQQITEQSHRKKKVITRSWVIQRAQDIVFTKLNPTAFCFHGLTCVRDVSHTAFLASCWKKKET